jgi:tripartite ATP-independent transporter DctM subunit
LLQDPFILLGLSFVLLFALLATGLQIAFALALVGIVGYFFYTGGPGMTALIPFRALDSFVLTAIPLFIFMGEVLLNSGASEMIYRGVSRLLAWAPGGLLHSNVGACAMFAAISGSSPATAATIGTVAIPALRKRGYDTNLTLGTLAAGGTLGILIPPSINMIFYSALTDTSVGKLFAGGVIPGILLAGMFMVYAAVRTILNPHIAPREAAFSIKAIPLSFIDLWPLYILAVIVLGGIFGGLITPTEAAALGSGGALIIALILRRLNWRNLRDSLLNAVNTTCMALFILVGASILAGFFSRAGIPIALSQLLINSGLSKIGILSILFLVYVFLGCFIDPLSMLVLTIPTMLPTLNALGVELIWFGVVVVILSELAMITPPVGVNLFVIQGISREDIGRVVRGSIPFWFMMLLAVTLLTIFPVIALWLPSLVAG